MGILDRFFGKAKVKPSLAVKVDCPHGVLVPKWNSVADMGKKDKISSYSCDSCHRSFNPEEGEALLAAAAKRLTIEPGAGSRQ